MYKFKNSLIAMSGLAAIAMVAPMLLPLVGFSSGSGAGNAPTIPTQNVNVVNTPSVSAQQSGPWSVGISNTPTVNLASGTHVSVDGTPTVNLATGSTVSVDGTLKIDSQNNTVKIDGADNTVKIDGASPIPVRDVDNPARQRFTYHALQNFPADPSFLIFSIDVPANKRLVIEQISVLGALTPAADQSLLVTVNCFSSGPISVYFVKGERLGPEPGGERDDFIASAQVRMYADSGVGFVRIYVARGDSGGLAADNAEVSLSGYLVDLP
jgi:hypothetical protein